VDVVFLYGFTTDQFVPGNWALTPPLQPSTRPAASAVTVAGAAPPLFTPPDGF
jgi:hypothetical protein